MSDTTTIKQIEELIEIAEARLELCDRPYTVFADHVLRHKENKGFLSQAKGGYNHASDLVSCVQMFKKDAIKFANEHSEYEVVYTKDILPETIESWKRIVKGLKKLNELKKAL